MMWRQTTIPPGGGCSRQQRQSCTAGASSPSLPAPPARAASHRSRSSCCPQRRPGWTCFRPSMSCGGRIPTTPGLDKGEPAARSARPTPPWRQGQPPHAACRVTCSACMRKAMPRLQLPMRAQVLVLGRLLHGSGLPECGAQQGPQQTGGGCHSLLRGSRMLPAVVGVQAGALPRHGGRWQSSGLPAAGCRLPTPAGSCRSAIPPPPPSPPPCSSLHRLGAPAGGRLHSEQRQRHRRHRLQRLPPWVLGQRPALGQEEQAGQRAADQVPLCERRAAPGRQHRGLPARPACTAARPAHARARCCPAWSWRDKQMHPLPPWWAPPAHRARAGGACRGQCAAQQECCPCGGRGELPGRPCPAARAEAARPCKQLGRGAPARLL